MRIVNSVLGLLAMLAIVQPVAAEPAAPVAATGSSVPTCRGCPEMVVVPAGSNVMGSSLDQLQNADVWAQVFREHEAPQHMITIAKPFAIGKYEVTRGQYAEFVKATNRPDPKGCAFHNPKTDIWVVELPGLSWRNPGYPQGDDHPVTCVTWDDAKAYVAWLSKTTGKNFRLPSEAEWEYAARGGASTVYPWGNGSESICNYAQILTAATVSAVGVTSHFEGTIDHPPTLACATHYAFTRPVGSLRPNAFGIYDMLGNVVELTEDCFHYNLAGLPTDGSAYHEANCKAHSSKGGGIFSAPMLARLSQRGGAPLDLHHSSQGFRVALDL